MKKWWFDYHTVEGFKGEISSLFSVAIFFAIVLAYAGVPGETIGAGLKLGLILEMVVIEFQTHFFSREIPRYIKDQLQFAWYVAFGE